MLAPGTKTDRYVVEGMLGQGGMAIVYRVRHQTLGTRHALKLLSVSGMALRERLVQEGRVQATLNHRNVVSVSDVIEVDGMAALVMEYVEGPSLDVWMQHYRPSLREAVSVFRGIVAGVGAAHEAGLVHRDLKPGNVLLEISDEGAVPRVTDFGLVKVRRGSSTDTRAGSTMGTPVYMAPEQIRDASAVDRRADLYSLGVILYELVCGETPYVGNDLISLFNQITAKKRKPPSAFCPEVTPNVLNTIDALMEVNPDNRVFDCAAALALLDGVEMEDITLNMRFEADEALPNPTPIPPMLPNATLPPGSVGVVVARSLVKRMQQAPTLPTEPGHAEPTEPAAKIIVVRQRSWVPWLLVALLVLLLVGGTLVGGTGMVLALWPSSTSDAKPSPTPTSVPVPVNPPPEPQPSAPEPVAPDPVRPAPAPLSSPRPAAPTPPPRSTLPVTPDPAPAPEPPPPAVEPAPAVEPGRFSVSADAGTRHVHIVGEAGSFKEGAAVPPGSYTVYARFADTDMLEMGGSLQIQSGETAVVRCSSGHTRCTWR